MITRFRSALHPLLIQKCVLPILVPYGLCKSLSSAQTQSGCCPARMVHLTCTILVVSMQYMSKCTLLAHSYSRVAFYFMLNFCCYRLRSRTSYQHAYWHQVYLSILHSNYIIRMLINACTPFIFSGCLWHSFAMFRNCWNWHLLCQ